MITMHSNARESSVRGDPDEIALFSASDESSYLTGIELSFDGGRARV